MKNLILAFFALNFCLLVSCNNKKISKPVLTTENAILPNTSSKDLEHLKKTSSISKVQFTEEAKGCESFTLYKLNADKTIGLRIGGERDILKLSKTTQKLLFGKDQIYASLYQFDNAAENYFCDDIADDNPKIIKKWDAIEGSLSTFITQDNISQSGSDKTYRMTLLIDSVLLKDKNNDKVELKNINFENVLVGRFGG